MDVELLRRKGVQPSNVREGRVYGFDLRIGARATLVPHNDGVVFGILVSLTHEEIEKLYTDKSVSDYRPEAITVTTKDEDVVPALCYNIVEFSKDSAVDTEYALALLKLADRLGFPSSYLGRIERFTGGQQ